MMKGSSGKMGSAKEAKLPMKSVGNVVSGNKLAGQKAASSGKTKSY